MDSGVGTENAVPVTLRIAASGASIAQTYGSGNVDAGTQRVTVAADSTGVLSVDDNGAALTIDWAGTAPPIGAGLEATALRVTLATDSTGLVSVDDNAGSLTIDNAQLSVVGSGTEAAALRVTLASDSTGLVSVDDNAGSLTVDNPTISVVGSGVEATAQRVTIASDSTGVLSVDDNGAALTIDWAGTAPPIGAGLEATALRVTLATDSTGVVSVDDNGGILTVDGTVILGAGTAEIGKLAAGVANIGDVDVLTIAAGDNNIGNVDIVTLPASTNTLEVVGDVAHDAAAAGNPVLVCGVAQDVDDTAPPNRVSAESDATRVATDRDGTQFVHPHGPQVWSYHENSSSALTDASVHALPGAGLSLYVTDIVCSTGAATAMNIFFEEATTTVLGPYYLEAVAGRGVALHFQTPKKITANTALTVTTSAAIAHSIDVTGFTAQG